MSTSAEDLLGIPELKDFKAALADAVLIAHLWTVQVSAGAVAAIRAAKVLAAISKRGSGGGGGGPDDPDPPDDQAPKAWVKMWRDASGKVGALTDRVSSGIKAIGEITKGVAFLDAWKSFGQDVAETTAKFENLGLTLGFLEGSSEKGQAALDWITALADQTGQDPMAVADAYIALREKGISPTAEQMLILADAAAKAGKGAEGQVAIASTLAAAMEKGTLGADQLKELDKTGVPALTLLAKAAGKTESQIEALANAGKLGKEAISTLWTAMGKDAAGANAAVANSYDGLIARVGLAWVSFKRAIGESGWLKWVERRLRDVLDLVARMKKDGSFQAWASAIGLALRAVGTVLAAFTRLVLETLDFLIDAFMEAPTWVQVLVGALSALLLALSPVTGPMMAIYGAITLLGLALDDLFAYLDGRPSVIGDIVAGFKEWWATLGPVTRAVAVVAATFAGLMAAVLVAPVLIGVLSAAVSVLTAVFGALASVLAFLFSPIGLIIAAVAALAGIAFLVYDNWSAITTWLMALWSSFVAWFQAKLALWANAAVTVGESLWEGLAGAFETARAWIQAKVEAIKAIFQAFQAFVEAVGQAVANAFLGAFDGIVAWIQAKIDAIKAAFDQGLLQGILQLFQEFSPATLLGEAMAALIAIFAGDEALAQVEAWFQRNIRDPIETALQTVRQLWEDFLSFLGIDGLIAKVEGLVPELPSVEDVTKGVETFLDNPIDTAAGWFGFGGAGDTDSTLALANAGGGRLVSTATTIQQQVDVHIGGPMNPHEVGSEVATASGNAVRAAATDMQQGSVA